MLNIATALLMAKNQLSTLYTKAEASVDVQILLSHVLVTNQAYLLAHPEYVLTTAQKMHFEALLAKRITGVPIAYLLGRKSFWSRSFVVSPAVLIPRPETELLVELILKFKGHTSQLSLLDLGTGSGVIAITMALERPEWQITALDISMDAINVAIQNSIFFDINHINFLISNWSSAIVSKQIFDVIVANPPYITQDDKHLQQGDLRAEPKIALISAVDGLQDLFIIIGQSLAKLKKNGLLLLEHGYQQASAVVEKMLSSGFRDVQTFTDLQGCDRVTIGFLNDV